MKSIWKRMAVAVGTAVAPLFGVVAQADFEEGGSIELRVVDRSGRVYEGERPVLYLASDRSGWDPAWLASTGSFEDGDGGWLFELDPSWLAGGMLGKFTFGDWASVERDASGRDIANRRFGLDMVEDGVMTMVVEGFADGGGGERASTVVGTLETFRVESEILGRGRAVRVWLPAGYGDEANAERSYPVMYMHDGQNLFDEATSFIGVEWGVDETLTELIEAGDVPPMIVVGMDNAGEFRASDYNPEGTAHNGMMNRGDLYLRFVLEEMMPLINKRYRTLQGPEHTGMGGSSFGGNATLYAAMRAPGVFGRILVESPASWIGDRVLVKMAREHDAWPRRVFIAMGDNEYGLAPRDAELVEIARDLHDAIEVSMEDDAKIMLLIEPGGVHNESAWARRLPAAMRFLWGDEHASGGEDGSR